MVNKTWTTVTLLHMFDIVHGDPHESDVRKLTFWKFC